jgi:hypothetical protein
LRNTLRKLIEAEGGSTPAPRKASILERKSTTTFFLKIATNFMKSSLSKAINGFKSENKLTKMTNISIVKKAE